MPLTPEEREAYVATLTDFLRTVDRDEAREIVRVLVDDHVAKVAFRTMQALGLLAVRGMLVDPRRDGGGRN